MNYPFHTSRFHALIVKGLFLFSLAIALSKSATNVAIALAYLLTLLFALYNRDFRRRISANWRQPLLAPLALYLLAAVGGLLLTEHLPDGIGITNKLSGLLLAYSMMSILLDVLDKEGNAPRSQELLSVFLVGIFALDIVGIMEYLGVIGHEKFVLPLAPLHVHHIWFSNLNAIGIYTAAGFLLFPGRRQKTRTRPLLILFVLLALVSILLSLSRTAWFGIFVTSSVLLYFLIPRKRFFISLAVMMTAGWLLYLFNGIFHERMNLIASDIAQFWAGQPHTNLGIRFLLWKASFKMFLFNPIFGAGTGDYVRSMDLFMASGEYPPFLSEFNQPHNMYFFALATNGLLGLSALLYIFYRGLAVSLPQLQSGGENKLFAFIAVATLIHYMAAGFTDSFFNIQILRYTFAFVMGVCIRAGLQQLQKNGEKGS